MVIFKINTSDEKSFSSLRYSMNYKSNRYICQFDIMNMLYTTIDSGIDIGQGINVKSAEIVKNNKHKSLKG